LKSVRERSLGEILVLFKLTLAGPGFYLKTDCLNNVLWQDQVLPFLFYFIFFNVYTSLFAISVAVDKFAKPSYILGSAFLSL